MQILGIDIGFGFTKATNGTDTIIFKSLLGDAAEVQYWADFGEDRSAEHIHVTIDGKSYFIGELAEQQTRTPKFTLDQEKLITDYVRALALTAAGLLTQNGHQVNVPVNVVSGLPIGYFKRNHERFLGILSGHHSVTYHSPHGQTTTKAIYINKVRMLPQPLGSILTIAGEIDRLWSHDWDIDLIILTGGGSRELARHLKPLIDGNVVPLKPQVDPRLNNVFGYIKYGKFVWGSAATSKSAGDNGQGFKPEASERTTAVMN